MNGSEQRKELANEMVLQAAVLTGSIHGFADSEKMATHWDDCDCDARTFWFHFRPKLDSRYSDKPALFSSTKRNGARVIGTWKRWAADMVEPYHYQLTFERLHSPTERYHGSGRFKTVSHVDPDYWLYKVTFYGGPGGIAI
jgi:hypothetical protein